MRLKDKIAVVTAASKGLGKGIALRFAQEGAKVIISSRNERQIQAAAEEIRSKTGAEVLALTVDVSRKEDIQSLVETIGNRYGAVDILVNNAGGPPAGKFMDFDDDAWYKAVDLNLMSVVRLTRGLVPLMMKNKKGRIINCTSVSVKEPMSNLILSNTIRSAVSALTKSLSNELAPYGILVNNLAPGRIATDRVKELDEIVAQKSNQSVEEVRENWYRQIALARYGTVEEFANAALFLASDESSYITGQILFVDGGLVKGY